ncbi:MAG: putative glycoside hydrolase [Gemmatimonadaceae bacterium]
MTRDALRRLTATLFLLSACTSRPEAQQTRGGENGADSASATGAEHAGPGIPVADDSILEPPPLVPTPEVVRGLYVNRWAAVGRKVWQLIDVAKRTEVNALVIDVKDDRGYMLYRSEVPLARKIGADTISPMSRERLRAMLDTMRAHDIYQIARIVVAKDPLLAEARPEWAIRSETDTATAWLDSKGKPWLDPHQNGVWQYAVDIAREAVALGFSEIQFDYVRFPDEKGIFREVAYPLAAGRTRAQVIRDQLGTARDSLESLGVPFTIDVFGLTTSQTTDMGIGQKWDMFIDRADVVLPMTYPSHYGPGSYGIARPNANPYDVIDAALESARRRLEGADSAASVIPWYQDFTLGAPRYGVKQVRAQMQAGYDNGFRSWMLWNPGSRYTIAALRAEIRPEAEERSPKPDSTAQPAPAPAAVADSLTAAPRADSSAARDSSSVSDSSVTPRAAAPVPDSSEALPDSAEALPDSTESLADSTEALPDSTESLADSAAALPDSAGGAPDSTGGSPRL